MFYQCLRSSTLRFWRKRYFLRKTKMLTKGDAIIISGALVPITHETCSKKHSNFHCGHLTGIKKAMQHNGQEYELWIPLTQFKFQKCQLLASVFG